MAKSTAAERALADLTAWTPGSESDLYPYLRELICEVLGYPRNRIRINEGQSAGIPDLSLFSQGKPLPLAQPWIVCEVKPDPGFFRHEANRKKVWAEQLRRYVTADTVYALLIDSTTIVVLFPDGKECGPPVRLEGASVASLRDETSPEGIAYLSFDASVGARALGRFINGTAPSRYLDVRTEEGQAAFGTSLRNSARELQEYALGRVKEQAARYDQFTAALADLRAKSIGPTPRLVQQEAKLREEYDSAVKLREETLPNFEAQIGRDLPDGEAEREEFIRRVYAVEAANLVLARILFVRFFEDYDMVTRKISNGGIKAFRSFQRNIQDDYQFLLKVAFRDLKQVYARLFEESIFDWAHEGNGELSRVLLRVFYRLNAFDFTQITGDILGNLYERFLDPKSRKELGEFYTPEFVVDHILAEVGFSAEPGPMLDPSCGSGTFLYRAIETAIQRFRAKGVPYPQAIEEAVKLANGIDVNIFAAFIAQLQVIWHLFPHLKSAGVKSIPNLNIYGGVDSLESGKLTTFEGSIILPRETAAIAIREGSYRYVVGNPPYLRAERMKAAKRWESNYAAVIEGKKDVAFYFLYRAIAGGANGINPWLEPGGRMGFISFGVADSKAGIKLRKTLLRHHLLALTDLETISNEVFTSGIAASRSTVAPIVIIAERTPAPSASYPVRVTVATRELCIVGNKVDLDKAPSANIPSDVFTDKSLNPFEHFATKLTEEDLEILRVLFKTKRRLRDYAYPTNPKAGRIAIQVGIQTGTGKDKVFDKPGPGRFPMVKGLHVHAFALNRRGVSEFVDLGAADAKSIWGYKEVIGRPAFIVSELGYAPQCCAVDTSKYVVQKSCSIFVPSKEGAEFPWDLYLNSSAVRLIFLLMFRSSLLEGADLWRSHLNSDAVKEFPVPRSLIQATEKLATDMNELRELGEKIVDRKLSLDESIGAAEKVSLATLEIRYENVTDFEAFRDACPELEVHGSTARLQPYVRGARAFQWIEGPTDLLTVIWYMMRDSGFQLSPAPGVGIPRTWKELAAEVRSMDVEVNPDVRRFRALFTKADSALSRAWGLTEAQAKALERRLSTAPLAVAQPRWPWTEAAMRATKTYVKDRFA